MPIENGRHRQRAGLAENTNYNEASAIPPIRETAIPASAIRLSSVFDGIAGVL
jgi:hypothetical protein